MLRPILRRAMRAIGVMAVVMLPLGPAVAADPAQTIKQSVDIQVKSDKDAARTQARIAQLADQTAELLGEYRLAIQQLDRVKIYNGHLQKLVDDQEAEKADIQRQLEDFSVVEQEIVPLMMNMIGDLEQFIELDMPFNMEERRGRVQRLRAPWTEFPPMRAVGAHANEDISGEDVTSHGNKIADA